MSIPIGIPIFHHINLVYNIKVVNNMLFHLNLFDVQIFGIMGLVREVA